MNEAILTDTFSKMGIELTKRQVCQFCDYYSLLVEWNGKMNLTSITEWDEVVLKHFADSLSVIFLFKDFDDLNDHFSCKTLADVGTGAGFPGIPLKIVFPDLKVTLMDSLDKRVKFLREVCDKLELEDISCVHGRVEDLARMAEYREAFDFATARAVASLPVLSEYCLPFVKENGIFIAYKSEKAEEELKSSENALSVLKGKVTDKRTFVLPDSDLSRTILFINKCGKLSNKYPRKAGTPSKQPL